MADPPQPTTTSWWDVPIATPRQIALFVGTWQVLDLARIVLKHFL